MRYLAFLLAFLFSTLSGYTQLIKKHPAQRVTTAFKIDGNLSEEAWKNATPATDFVEWRPNPGKVEAPTSKTIVYLLYDQTSIYIGGFCQEQTKDSISRELIGRDKVGINDFVGVLFDTYHDRINGFGFYVTPYGEQYDAKYSSTLGEDGSWDGVWSSAAKIHENGWSFEMRIPYSALRFVSRDNQTWGLNITRKRNKTGQQFMWNPIDPKINGFMNQEGEWTGIEKLETPVRLSFSPYLSMYTNYYKSDPKKWRSAVNGGMDIKFGLTDAFTLDMTLIPDFGQVISDNKVLNLSPFEVQYQENRPFFTEGTELFTKGDLFYSRRIGSIPINFGSVHKGLDPSRDTILQNPIESKLINATKISGRTRNGLGVGFFNAITKPMYALVQDKVSQQTREVETGSLVNYNILVVDQTLKNNSSVSLINTNVLRNGSDRDANVTSALASINTKGNTYGFNGNVSVSQVFEQNKKKTGYFHNVGFGKQSGNWMFNLNQSLTDENYDKNDLGIQFNRNYIDHSFWTGYRWLKPKDWYNKIELNFNATLSRRLNPGDYQIFFTNINGSVQFKNLWFAGFFVGLNARGNDFYEPRLEGRYFKSPESWRSSFWVESNSAKKYSFFAEVFSAANREFDGKEISAYLRQSYRFSDKLSLSHVIRYAPSLNNVGFSRFYNDPVTRDISDIIFSRRDISTIENTLNAKYNFNNRSGITLRVRHYWREVVEGDLYDLKDNGTVSRTTHADIRSTHRNFNIFNVDAQYTLQFAPGSFVYVVWKDESSNADLGVKQGYGWNFSQTLGMPQNHNLSVRVIYFLDYLDLKKKKGPAATL